MVSSARITATKINTGASAPSKRNTSLEGIASQAALAPVSAPTAMPSNNATTMRK